MNCKVQKKRVSIHSTIEIPDNAIGVTLNTRNYEYFDVYYLIPSKKPTCPHCHSDDMSTGIPVDNIGNPLHTFTTCNKCGEKFPKSQLIWEEFDG